MKSLFISFSMGTKYCILVFTYPEGRVGLQSLPIIVGELLRPAISFKTFENTISTKIQGKSMGVVQPYGLGLPKIANFVVVLPMI
jgi:hypothetical protein